jgi:hypothetical protein
MMSGLAGSFEHACFEAEDRVRRDKDMEMTHLNAGTADHAARMDCRLLADCLACMMAFPPDFDLARDDVDAARQSYVQLRDDMVSLADTAPLDEVQEATARFRDQFEAIIKEAREAKKWAKAEASEDVDDLPSS